jgi:hypothetical protein
MGIKLATAAMNQWGVIVDAQVQILAAFAGTDPATTVQDDAPTPPKAAAAPVAAHEHHAAPAAHHVAPERPAHRPTRR